MDWEKVPETVRDYLLDAYASAKNWRLPNGKVANQFRPVELHEVGVIGGGTMGRGIAIAVARAGYRTILIETDQKFLDMSTAELGKTIARDLKLKRMTAAEAEIINKNLRYSTDLDALRDCDMIIEVIFENMKLKKELFGKLDRICKKSCVFGSNTSSLDIDELASPLSDKTKLVGIHFFNPAQLMKTIEIIAGKHTSGEAVATAFAISNRMHKLPVLVGNCPGFVFNRILFVYIRAAGELMSKYGYSPKQVDQLMMDFGMAQGPAAMQDMNGLDVGAKVSQENGFQETELQRRLVAMKRYGRKTGRGYYLYSKEGKKLVDPEVEKLVVELKNQAGKRTRIDDDKDALEFILYPMINEAFKLVENGMIADLAQIDLMLIFGLGWPPATGGLIKYIMSHVGLHKVKARLDQWHVELGSDDFKAAKMLDAYARKSAKSNL